MSDDRFWERDLPTRAPPAPSSERWWEGDLPEHARKGRDPISQTLGIGGERFQWWPERIAREIGTAAKNLYTAPGRALEGEFGHPTSEPTPQMIKEMAEGGALVSPINPAYRLGSRYGAPPRQAGERGVVSPLNPLNDYRWEHAPRRGEMEAVTAAEALGAPLPRGYTGGQGSQILTQAVRALPLAGNVIDRQVTATREAAGRALAARAAELGEPNPATLGSSMKTQFQELVERNKTAIDDAYKDTRSLIDPDAVHAARHTQRAYEDVLRKRLAARQENPQAGLEQVTNIVDQGISFNGLIRAKNDLAQQVDFLAAHTGLTAGDRKEIGTAMKRDLHEIAMRARAPGVTPQQALAAIRNAEGTAAPLITLNTKLRGMTQGTADETLGGVLVGAGREKGGNVALLGELRRSLPPDQFNLIAGATLHDIGFNTGAGKFTLDQFATRWGQYSQQAKAMLFTPQHRKFLDDVGQLGRHMKEAEIAMNRSGTARPSALAALITAAGSGVAQAAWTGNLSILLGLAATTAGGYALAGAMARPEIAASAARFARHAIRYDRHPNMAAAAALRLATFDYMRMLQESGHLSPEEMGRHAARGVGLSGEPEGGRPYPPGQEPLPSLEARGAIGGTMAGTIYGLSLSQVMDSSGRLLSGAKLYLYVANTTEPVTSYQTADLAPGQENPWPIVSDNRGRLPSFWLPDGSYHVRLVDAADGLQFDEGNVLAIGSGSTSSEAIDCTGDIKFRLGAEALSGWLKLNGQTLGNAGSGAAVASDEYEDIFTYLWDNFDDSICPVSGGRFTAANDFAAGKMITMLDLRGRAVVGLDDMGNAPANRLGDVSFSPGDAITGGSAGGLLQVGTPGVGFMVGTWYIRV